MKLSLLGGFLLRALFWLLLLLLLWYVVGSVMAMIVGWPAGAVMHLLFPSWADGASLSGSHVDLITNLRLPMQPGMPAGAVPTLSPEADYLTYGYGMPLLFALFLASNSHHMLGKAALAFFVLLPFQMFSLIFVWLKQVAIVAGPAVAGQTSFSEPAREVIALGYQFGTLILPTLAPVAIWLALDRTLVSTLLVEAYLERAEPEDGQPPSSYS